PLARGFVELARMTRHRAAIGKDHGPRDLSRAAVELAIDEIRNPAKEEADRDRLGDDVGEGPERDLPGAGEQNDGDGYSESAAVEGTPAMPHVEGFERVKHIIVRLVEQNVADAPAEHDPQRRPDQEIVDVLAAYQTRRTPSESEAIAPT